MSILVRLILPTNVFSFFFCRNPTKRSSIPCSPSDIVNISSNNALSKKSQSVRFCQKQLKPLKRQETTEMIFKSDNNKQQRSSLLTHPPILKSPMQSLPEELNPKPPEIIISDISSYSPPSLKPLKDTRIPSLSSLMNYGTTYLEGNVRKTNNLLDVIVKVSNSFVLLLILKIKFT